MEPTWSPSETYAWRSGACSLPRYLNCMAEQNAKTSPHPSIDKNHSRRTSSAMALRLAVQALSARSPLPRAETRPKPPQRPRSAATSRRRLAATAAAVLASQLLPPVASSGAGTFDLRLTLPEKSSEEAEAVVRTHARNLLGVRRFIDAGAWRELQTALRASASNLKQDLYAIIQARPTAQRPELRRLYSNLFNSVTSLDYAARDKDKVQVQEHYGNNIVSALDEIFAKIM